MSEERITLELVGARLMALTADVRDLQQRFDGVETRLGALEARFGVMERRFAFVHRLAFAGAEFRV